jgi:hypothetical protein
MNIRQSGVLILMKDLSAKAKLMYNSHTCFGYSYSVGDVVVYLKLPLIQDEHHNQVLRWEACKQGGIKSSYDHFQEIPTMDYKTISIQDNRINIEALYLILDLYWTIYTK